jgi:cobalt/nickel transport system permease protein
MHLGNGAITPECVVLTAGAAAAGLGLSCATMWKSKLTQDKLLAAGGLGCFVFACQMINVPVASGISGHFVGGVLLASLLGPGLGACTMALVLAIQAVVLGDGGIVALGANLLNMALLPAVMMNVARRLTRNLEHPVIVGGLVACCAVPLAAGLIGIETALFRPAAELASWSNFAAKMLVTHAWIGVFEGALTAALIAAIAPLATRPETALTRRVAVGIALAALIVAMLLPISSNLPDGYEAAAMASGLEWLLAP